jgi:hypothetical protein
MKSFGGDRLLNSLNWVESFAWDRMGAFKIQGTFVDLWNQDCSDELVPSFLLIIMMSKCHECRAHTIGAN